MRRPRRKYPNGRFPDKPVLRPATVEGEPLVVFHPEKRGPVFPKLKAEGETVDASGKQRNYWYRMWARGDVEEVDAQAAAGKPKERARVIVEREEHTEK